MFKFLSYIVSRFISRQEEEEIDMKYIQTQESEHRKQEFENILSFADELFKNNQIKMSYDKTLKQEEHPIIDLIRALGLSIKSKYIINLIKDGSRLPDIDTKHLFFSFYEPINNKNQSINDLMIKVSKKISVDLKNDLVLPWPWNRERLVDSIVSIGKGRFWGEWKQDRFNHFVTLWLPMGVSSVDGGNHSITTGIIKGEGVLTPELIYDISPVYEFVYCDGEYYRKTQNDEIISSVKNVEFAAIFEIGRKMSERNISYKSIL